MSHYEGLKEESIKSIFDSYPYVIKKEQSQPRTMLGIDNKEKTLNIVLLEPKEASSKVVQE